MKDFVALILCCIFTLGFYPQAHANDTVDAPEKLEWSEWKPVKLLNASFSWRYLNPQVIARCAWTDYSGPIEGMNAVLIIQFKMMDTPREMLSAMGLYRLPPEVDAKRGNSKVMARAFVVTRHPIDGQSISTIKVPLNVVERIPVEKIQLEGRLNWFHFLSEHALIKSTYKDEIGMWDETVIRP